MPFVSSGRAGVPSVNDAEIQNFRDLGGIRTMDARTVKHGRIFRSSALDGLSPGQHERIARLGVRLIVDFRSGIERGVIDGLYAVDGVRVWHAPDGSTTGAPQHSVEAFLARPPGDRSIMQNLYRATPLVQAAGFRALYAAIADGELPLVFHCAAGKDRTGVAAALLLDALGVERDAILADYLLSGAWFDHTRDEFLVNFPDRQAILASEDHWRPMLQTDASYLEAMFDEIGRRYGDARGYMHQELGMTNQSIDRIASLLLE